MPAVHSLATFKSSILRCCGIHLPSLIQGRQLSLLTFARPDLNIKRSKHRLIVLGQSNVVLDQGPQLDPNPFGLNPPTMVTSIQTVDGLIQTSHVPVTSRSTTIAEYAAMGSLRQCHTDLERYLYLRNLREINEELFYKVLINNAQEILPYVYTPTVGEACQKYSHLPINTRGLFITPADKGRILEKLKTWPESNIRVIVVTDGERILGLGDLGYGGMGISEGKILLYTVVGGVDPKQCLPICIDIGTNNKELLQDPNYKGLKTERLRGPEYDDLLEEFMTAVRTWKPHVLLQFEDFGNNNAFRLLEKYRGLQCCFNDDIQGTACITLAGVSSALRVTGKKLEDQKILFLGAGEAGTGIAQLIAMAMHKKSGIPLQEALKKCFFLDSKGLICSSRTGLQHHKLPFAHDIPYQKDLLSAVQAIKPSALIGVSTQAGAFSKDVLQLMAEINERPIIFPLSNPTSKSECTYEEAFEATGGRVVFASGSPFPELISADHRHHYPAQANNAYIFGPIGMAAILTRCKFITDDIFLKAAEILADLTPQEELESGRLFPTFSAMKTLVVPLIAKTAEYMVDSGLGTKPAGEKAEWEKIVQSSIFTPSQIIPRSSKGSNIKVSTKALPEVHEEELNELTHLREMYTDLQRYLFLRNVLVKDKSLFWKLMINNAQEILPYVYTPTVGEVCQKYSRLPIHTHGLFLSYSDKGNIFNKLKSFTDNQVRVIVVTDGERILGLGDLGYGGMGISEGKIMLYTVIAGVDPSVCLPVCLDVGTNNPALLNDPNYKGWKHERIRGREFDEFLDEFMSALRKWQPHLLLQFEDFGNTTAFRLLDKFRNVQCCFNDDIQGTACIVLSGLFSALRVTKKNLLDQVILFHGAGEAGAGIANLIAMAISRKCGISEDEARKKCFFLDSKGLVCKSRTDLAHHKIPFAHDVPFVEDLLSAVKTIKPSMLVGVSTQAGAFSKQVLSAMAEINARPIIFPLSNPTSKSECTFVDAYKYTKGKVVFASGSPFPPYTTHDELTIFPAQANNAYIFGPIGMAAILTNCKIISDDVFLETAEILSKHVPKSRLESGMLFPAFSDMKVVAPHLIADVAKFMVDHNIGFAPAEINFKKENAKEEDIWVSYVLSKMFHP